MEENEGALLSSSFPLLKKNFCHSNCPGCRVDLKKSTQTGFPVKEILSIWLVVLCTSLPISSLFPFLYFMTRDFHIADREEDIGYYAGYVGSSFMFGRALTSIFWGLVADKYGRKPVIIVGILTVVIFNALFGLSLNFWFAISTRFLLGALNGLLGPIKAYAIELISDDHQALAVSSVSTAWGIGLVVGPAVGGFLAQPCQKYPSFFSPNSIFCKFPYFLPCFSISIFGILVLIFSFFLPETLHMHHCNDDTEKTREKTDGSFSSLFKNWALMSSIIVYCVFSLHDMAYTEIFSLWAVSGRKYGGLGFSTEDVGTVLTVSGIGLLVFQMSVYSALVRKMGSIMVSRMAGVISVFILGSYPFMAMLSGWSLYIMINSASVAKNSLSLAIITGLFLLQNSAVAQNQRGVANGISMTAMSLFKAVGPAGGGAVFSWAQKRQDAGFLPGDQMVFFVLNILELVGIVMTFKPFLVTREDYKDVY